MVDARTHVYRHMPDVPVEAQLFGEVVTEGQRVLDIGTAAQGRSALGLAAVGAHVTSIEINNDAIHEFAASESSGGIELTCADMTHLPFDDCAFDHVVIALHGLDYLVEPEVRIRALKEVDRVLRAGGALIFNGYNRVGILLSPAGYRSIDQLKVRARHIVRGFPVRRALVDANGLRLHQAMPRTVIREVEKNTGLRVDHITNLSGSTTNTLAVSLFAEAPYYVFTKV